MRFRTLAPSLVVGLVRCSAHAALPSAAGSASTSASALPALPDFPALPTTHGALESDGLDDTEPDGQGPAK
jgi:hypothetical protein